MFFETPEARALPTVQARRSSDKGRFEITLKDSGGWYFRDPLRRMHDRIFLARRFAIMYARGIEAYERGDEMLAEALIRATDYDNQCRALGYS